jgi:hypothetical protein
MIKGNKYQGSLLTLDALMCLLTSYSMEFLANQSNTQKPAVPRICLPPIVWAYSLLIYTPRNGNI